MGLIDSAEEGLDSPNDKVIKTVFVRAVLNQRDLISYSLVVFVEVEVVDIGPDGEDDGFFEPAIEAFRLPFPPNPQVRKALLRDVCLNPPFYIG